MGDVLRLRAPAPARPKPARARLTKRAIERLTPDPAGGDRWLRDGELPGFAVRMKASGVATYVVTYRDASRRTRRVALGRVGVLTVEQARKAALQALAGVSRGENPAAERHRARREAAGATVADVVKGYLAFVAARRKPSTVAGYRSVAERLILPKIGRRVARDLTVQDVRDWHVRLHATPTSANRALALLSAAFNFAGDKNPCRAKRVERYPERSRSRFLDDAELRRVFAVLAEGERTRTLADGVVTALRLLLLTGCRLGEVLGLRWEDVDPEAGALRLPDAKAGARVVPLAPVAVELLANLPRRGPFVAPGRAEGKPVNVWTLEGAWHRIRQRADIADVRIHDLRHTVGTHAGAAGLNAYHVRDLLGHKTLAMSNRYVATDLAPARAAAALATARIAAAMRPPLDAKDTS